MNVGSKAVLSFLCCIKLSFVILQLRKKPVIIYTIAKWINWVIMIWFENYQTFMSSKIDKWIDKNEFSKVVILENIATNLAFLHVRVKKINEAKNAILSNPC